MFALESRESSYLFEWFSKTGVPNGVSIEKRRQCRHYMKPIGHQIAALDWQARTPKNSRKSPNHVFLLDLGARSEPQATVVLRYSIIFSRDTKCQEFAHFAKILS